MDTKSMEGFKLVFYAEWSDYEEDGFIIISEKDGQYYCQEGGHCVMNTDANDNREWNPEPISADEALSLMIEWEEYEDTEPPVPFNSL